MCNFKCNSLKIWRIITMKICVGDKMRNQTLQEQGADG